MAVIKTIEKGESLTFGFVLPETYNLDNLQSVKIYIGSTVYTHTMVSRTARVELSSNATALLTGRNVIHLVIDDAVFGIKKINCGELEVLPTQATHKDESVNTGYDVEIVLSINVETISVGGVLYNTLKGDKGDAGTIEVGTVTTGDAGTDVIVENVGTPSEAVLNFTMPRGDAGYTPYIGENGNWFINGIDTGVQAEGDATESWVGQNYLNKLDVVGELGNSETKVVNQKSITLQSIKAWSLSESFSISSPTFDSTGNISGGVITWPDNDVGSISNVTVGANGITSIRYNRSEAGKYATVNIAYDGSGVVSNQTVVLTGF